MGANIKVNGDTLHIRGVPHLRGSQVYASDIRAGAALVLAGLAAQGKTTIENADQILRGYENPQEKLRLIGSNCRLTA